MKRYLKNAVIKKFKRRKDYARFKDYILAADLAEMGSLSSLNRGVKYLLCVIDVSKRKPNKLSVSQEKEFYNKLTQKWLGN